MSQSSSQSSQSPRHIDQQGIEPRGDARLLADLASTPSPSPAQASFTPGPWSVYEEQGSMPRIIVNSNHNSVADANAGFPCSESEQDANACLIASAPTLYATLLAIAEGIERDLRLSADPKHPICRETLANRAASARTALALAEGK